MNASTTMAPSWPAQPGAAASYQAAPAFTPVQVRQTFGQPASTTTQTQYPPHSYGTGTTYPTVHAQVASTNMYSPAAPAPEVPKKKVEWPDAVRNYVQRSLAEQDPNITKAEIEAKLKDTIGQANAKDILFSIDWDTMPLPQQMIREERARNSALPQALHQQARISEPPHPHVSDNYSRPMTYAAAVSGPNSKKRKSNDFPDPAASAAPPWRAGGRLEDRVTRPQEPAASKSKFQQKMEKRQKRFDGGYKSTYRSPSPPPTRGPVVGTSQERFKRYLRLTSAPNPANVRPESVLRDTLFLLKKKWSLEENYSYTCDQFKSMRQDLTVQRIRTDFTVEVYECHARIALEKGDLGEYNQCQTQLTALYKQGLKGNASEFKAYRILYFIHTANRIALNDLLATLTPAEKKDKGIKHALDVRSALALGNYHRFFSLYAQTPNMGGWLMDMFVKRERLNALCYICKSYKPVVPLRFVTEELFFESDADAAQFIVDHDGAHLLSEKDDTILFASGKALPIFATHRTNAFSRIDIKGQL